MSPASPTRFGTLLRLFRKQGGLSHQQLSELLNVAPADIKRLEAGKRTPPCESAFYERLHTVPGVSNSDITLLLLAAAADTATTALTHLAEFTEEQAGQE